jgi:hypothetical protein
MTRTVIGEGMESHLAAQPAARRDAGPPELDDIRAELETLAGALRAVWSSTLERGDFDEITQLVEASHAVHCAVVALSPGGLLPESSPFRVAATGR